MGFGFIILFWYDIFEGNAKVTWFEGNFEDYENMYLKKLGTAAQEGRRAKFRRFSLW